MPPYVWEGSVWLKDTDGAPVVMMYGRDTDNPTTVRRIGYKGFIPYFWREDKETPTHLSCFGDPISKVEVFTPDEVPRVRRQYEKTFEADIPFDMRFVVDKGIYYGFDDHMHPVDIPTLPPRICYFDIEVSSPKEIMPRIGDPKWPIVMIQVLDSYTDKITVFTLNGEIVDDCQENYSSEVSLLKAFFDYISATDFDIITGWFSEGFDIPYIIRRARILKVSTQPLSRTPALMATENRFPGRTKIDLLIYYKDWSKPVGQLPTYDLKFVYKHECGVTYTDYGDRIDELITNKDWKTLVQYGKNDVVALRDIDRKTGLIMFYENLRRIVGIKFEDTLQRAKIIEYFLMHKGIKPMPTRQHVENVSDYKGALVLKPTFGVKEWVGVCDLKCVDDITEVLTDEGWKLIKDLDDESVATLNVETGYIEYDDTYSITSSYYRGTMYEVDKLHLNMCVTPNHRLLIHKYLWSKGSPKSYWSPIPVYMTVEQIKSGGKHTPYKVPFFGKWKGVDKVCFPSNNVHAFLKLLGLWIADGHLSGNLTTSGSMVISQKKSQNLDTIRETILSTGFTHKEYTDSNGVILFHIFNIKLVKWLISVFGHNSSRTKYIPSWILQLDHSLLQSLFDGLIIGDGSIDGNGRMVYYTTSKRLADNIQEIGLKLGMYSVVREYDYQKGTLFYKLGFSQQINKERSLSFVESDLVPLHYDGRVYCLTTRNENFVIRRKGRVSVTGNSLYPSIILAFDISPDIDKMIPKIIVDLLEEREKLRRKRLEGSASEADKISEQSIKYVTNACYGYLAFTGARLHKPELAAFITRMGREISVSLHKKLGSMGYQVVYGDSVSSDAVVYSSSVKDGEVLPSRIEDLFKEVTFLQFDKEIYVPEHLYVESVDANGRLEMVRVRKIIRHQCSKQMYRVGLNNLTWIDVTEDHSLIGIETGHDKATFPYHCRMREVSPVGLKGSICTRRRLLYRETPCEFTKEFCEFVGYFIGDGSFDKKIGERSYYVYLATGNDQHEVVTKVLDPLLAQGSIRNYWCRDNGDVQINGVELIRWIEDNCRYEKGKTIPRCLQVADEQTICWTLRGIFSSDGTVGYTKNNRPLVQFLNTNYDIVVQVQEMLFRVGIASSIFVESNTNMYDRKVSSTYTYHVVVKDISLFRDKIGFIEDRKSSRLVWEDFKYDEDITISRVNYVIPIEYTGYVYDIEVESESHVFFANNILVHNTDSTFITVIKDGEEGRKIEGALNQMLAEWAEEHGIKPALAPTLKLEKIYKTLMFKKSSSSEDAAKKRYAGHLVWKDGYEVDKIDYTGLEIKRSDTSRLTREMMEKFFELVLKEGKVSEAVQVVKENMKKVQQGQVSVHDVAVPKGVHKTERQSPHVRGMKYGQDLLGIKFREDKKPKLLYCTRPVDVVCIDDDISDVDVRAVVEVDWKRMALVCVEMKMKSLVESLGLSWEEMLLGQKGLGEWLE